MRFTWIGAVALAITPVLFSLPELSVAEDAQQQLPSLEKGGAFPEDPSLSKPPLSAEALEIAIRQLKEPVDQELLGKIFSSLARVENSSEQQRLQRLFDERMQELMKIPEQPVDRPQSAGIPAGTSAKPPKQEITDEELRMRIETLTLGPKATVDELRARDELVAAIANVRDPVVRDTLLGRLEEREREGERVTEKPPE